MREMHNPQECVTHRYFSCTNCCWLFDQKSVFVYPENTHYPVTILDIQCTIQDKLRNYLDELNEGDEKTPGMRSIYNQSLQQHPCDLLLYNFLRKSMQE
jgi:hypothetical protein